MPAQQEIAAHYTHGNLTAAIRGGIEKLGKTIDSVTVDDLAPVDEFHIGGRQASEHFLDQLELTRRAVELLIRHGAQTLIHCGDLTIPRVSARFMRHFLPLFA